MIFGDLIKEASIPGPVRHYLFTPPIRDYSASNPKEVLRMSLLCIARRLGTSILEA